MFPIPRFPLSFFLLFFQMTEKRWERYFFAIGREPANISFIFNYHYSANWRERAFRHVIIVYRMNLQAIMMDLHYSWYLKIPSNCTRLKAWRMLRKFSNSTCCINLWLYRYTITNAIKSVDSFSFRMSCVLTTGFLQHVKKYIIWIIFHFAH